MEDESQTGQKPDQFKPAVNPEKLTEGKIFWVEAEDGSKINLGNVVRLKLQQGETWTVEATTTNSENIVIGRYTDQATAEQAMSYMANDSERHANGSPEDTTHGLPKTHGGRYNEANVRERHRIETTPLDGE